VPHVQLAVAEFLQQELNQRRASEISRIEKLSTFLSYFYPTFAAAQLSA